MLVIITLLGLVILLMVLATVGIKSLRTIGELWQGLNQKKLEPLLENYLHHGVGLDALCGVSSRKLNRYLTPLLIERIRYVRGASRGHMTQLAHDLGLVRKNHSALNSRRRWHRARAAERLGYLGGAEQVQALGALLVDKDETVRAVAARALTQIATPSAVDILVRTLDDPSELTRLRVAENLDRLGPQAVPHLISRAREWSACDDNSRCTGLMTMLSVLGGMRSPQARSVLRATIDTATNATVRAEAVWALGRCGGPGDVRLLITCAGDKDWAVRKQAANA
ncbi:HEAT repeat domain-containing protein [Nesterenkonia natronophila]|nr:HEAT repeat domain-containing protein [Nesterenkonia natronophila]